MADVLIDIGGDIKEASVLIKLSSSINDYSIEMDKVKYKFQYESRYYKSDCENGNWADGFLHNKKTGIIDCRIKFIKS